MREANSPIHPDDLPTLTRNHQAYLDDEDGLTTNAAKLQDDAYALGYRRARQSFEALDGITLHAQGEANFYRLMRAGRWLAVIQMNGELLVWDQESILRAMLQGDQQAGAAAHKENGKA